MNKITEIDGQYKSSDGKIYYFIALYLATGKYIRIKNAGCQAAAESIGCDFFHVENNSYAYKQVKVFFQNTSAELDMKWIPKKYHKYFKEA